MFDGEKLILKNEKLSSRNLSRLNDGIYKIKAHFPDEKRDVEIHRFALKYLSQI